jgi:hypothetical protein
MPNPRLKPNTRSLNILVTMTSLKRTFVVATRYAIEI